MSDPVTNSTSIFADRVAVWDPATQTYLDVGGGYSEAAVDALLLAKAPVASPTFTGSVSGITPAMIGLDQVDNTSDADKPASIDVTALLALKPGYNYVNTELFAKANLVYVNNQLALKANLASPTFTGTVGGVTKTMVGLASADNTSDANKPVSAATTTQLALKANLASPTFTGTVTFAEAKASFGGITISNSSDSVLLYLSDNGLNGVEIVPKLRCFDDLRVDGASTLIGNLSCPSLSGGVLSQINPFHCAGRVSASAMSVTKGRHSFTVTKPSTGFFVITFAAAHPDGSNFIALGSGEGITGSAWNIVHQATGSSPHVNTSTSVTFIVRDNNFNEVNGSFDFVVLA